MYLKKNSGNFQLYKSRILKKLLTSIKLPSTISHYLYKSKFILDAQVAKKEEIIVKMILC